MITLSLISITLLITAVATGYNSVFISKSRSLTERHRPIKAMHIEASKVQRSKCIIVVIVGRSQMSSTHLSHPPSLLQLQQQMSKSCTDTQRIDTDAEE